ncbi:MAG: hypothetical protein KC656_28845, partial [Myxococcales bacterium]|nr:hypothetical protein [Myxococcales bacterium]
MNRDRSVGTPGLRGDLMMMWWFVVACRSEGEPTVPVVDTSSDCPAGSVDVDGSCVSCDARVGTLHERHLRVDGEQRAYLLHVPEAYTCDERWPVLFDLHGTAGALPEEAYGLDGAIETADAEGFLLVRPRSRSSLEGGSEVYRWDQNPGDTDRNAVFLEALLERLSEDYVIDPDRVYVMGFSSGTNQTARAARDADSPFHGFGHVGGGAWSVQEQRASGRTYLHTPWRDYMRAYHHQLVELLDEAGSPAADRYERQSSSGHDLYDWIYPELWAFLDRGERPDPGTPSADWERIPGAPEQLLAVTVDEGGTAWFTGVDGDVLSWDGDAFAVAAIEGAAVFDETSLTGVCFTGGGTGAAVGNGTVLWTDDAGVSWRHLDPLDEPGPPMFGYTLWTGVACSPTEVLGMGYWSAGRSSDGVDWQDAVMGTSYRVQAQAAAQAPTG